MTEEEKKAIDYFKSNAEFTKELGKKWGFQEEIKNNEIILNLIQKQEIEINKLKKDLDIIKCNYEILQGEMDRIGIDTLHLDPGNSTDDVIEEINKLNNVINKIKNKLEEHIKHCEQEANGSLNNQICHISLKFDKGLLEIINKEDK